MPKASFKAALKRLESRNQEIRDRIRMVVGRDLTGLYLYGRAGVAKTTIVSETLKKMKVDFVYRQGYITARRLFEILAENPDAIIVLDDVGGCMSEKKFYTLMLSALQKRKDGNCMVSYETAHKPESVRFSGSIIFVGNVMPEGHDRGVLEAFRQRIVVIHYDPTDAEIEARIRQIADQHMPGITRLEARAVAEQLIAEARRLNIRLAIRHYVDIALRDFRAWKWKRVKTPWTELLRTVLSQEQSSATEGSLSAKEQQRQALREIWPKYRTFEQRAKAFELVTGRGKDTMYRRLRELRDAGVLPAA